MSDLMTLVERRLEDMAGIQSGRLVGIKVDDPNAAEQRYEWEVKRLAELREIAANIIAELVASRVRYQEEPGRSAPYTLNSRGEIDEVWPSTMEGELADPEDWPHSPSWHAQAEDKKRVDDSLNELAEYHKRQQGEG